MGAAIVVIAAAPARAQTNPFAGAWNITPEAPARGVYWLEVGKSLDAWGVQIADRAVMWSVVDDAMTNEPKANNLVWYS